MHRDIPNTRRTISFPSAAVQSEKPESADARTDAYDASKAQPRLPRCPRAGGNRHRPVRGAWRDAA